MKANLDIVKGIGTRIASRRREVGLSQAALADLSGGSTPGLGNWERDVRLPGCEYLPSLSAALNVRLEWLLTGANSTSEYIEKVVRPVQLKRAALYPSEHLRTQVEFTYYAEDAPPKIAPSTLPDNPTSPAIEPRSGNSVPLKIDEEPGESLLSALDIIYSRLPNASISPIQKALLITVAEVIDGHSISDEECLQELLRWHSRK